MIERLPGGWATNVGEGGALLSGGERQRVSIARALLKDAPIVLLDEVTSALDPVNEAAVHEGIERLMAGRTVVMVAHRMRTVRRADRVVFLDGGRIVEAGQPRRTAAPRRPLRRVLGPVPGRGGAGLRWPCGLSPRPRRASVGKAEKTTQRPTRKPSGSFSGDRATEITGQGHLPSIRTAGAPDLLLEVRAYASCVVRSSGAAGA